MDFDSLKTNLNKLQLFCVFINDSKSKNVQEFLNDMTLMTFVSEHVKNNLNNIKQNFENPSNVLQLKNLTDFLDNFKEITYDKVLEKTNSNLTFFNSFDLNDKNLSNNYIKYLENQISQINAQIDSLFASFDVVILNSGNSFSQLAAFFLLEGSLYKSLDNYIDLFEKFKYANKNYVLFGKNGAGKTRLIKKLSTTVMNNDSVFIIPADRSIHYQDAANLYDSQYEKNLKELFGDNNLHDIIKVLNNKVFVKNANDMKTKLENNNIDETKTIETKILEIFNGLGLERKLKIYDNRHIKLYDDDIDEYSLESASDGEKSICLLIMYTMLLAQDSILLIDEPENHLNGSLMINFFDKLENIRPDIVFVYATHNIQFIESRVNAEIVYLKKTKDLEKWDYEPLAQYQDIPLSVLLSIAGSKKNIIFCESNDKSGLDYKLYSKIFSAYEIVPVGGCNEVIDHTQALNRHSKQLLRQAIGILDKDRRTNNEIDSLKNKNIVVSNYNEIENVFYDEVLIDKVFHEKAQDIKNTIKNAITEGSDAVKTDVIEKITQKYISKAGSRNIIKREFKFAVNNYDDSLQKYLEDKINKPLKKSLKNFDEEFSKAIEKNSYTDLIKLVNGKLIYKPVELFEIDENELLKVVIAKINVDLDLKNHLITEIGVNDDIL